MTEWNTIVFILCLLMLVFLSWKEWSRINKSLLLLRILASAILVASLYFLAVPLNYTKKILQKENSLVILTEGYKEDSLRNLLAKEKMKVYHLDDTELEEILIEHKGINTIHVLGYGLEKYQLNKLVGQELIFHPTTELKGFTSIHYKKELEQGEPLNIEGNFQYNAPGKVTVMLMDFGMIVDSVAIESGKTFILNHIPSHIGRSAYTISAISEKDTLEKQQLPVYVNEPESLKVLFLNSAPGFESRFLKQWLSSKGYQVIARTRVSKNTFSKEFVNEDRSSVDRISPGILDGIDCIVADNGALAALSGSELSFIKKSISENGLGLLIAMDGEESRAATPVKIQMNRSASGRGKLVLRMSDGKILTSLNTENQYSLSASEDVQTLVKDLFGKVYAGVAKHGRGQIVLNTINYSYKWMLSGQEKDYNAFWQALLSKALGRKISETWTVREELPFVNEPLTIDVETEKTEPVGIINGQQVNLKNNWQIGTDWEGYYWPRKAGWQSVTKSDGSSSWFYVFKDSDWKALRLQNRTLETRGFTSLSGNTAGSAEKKEIEEEKQVPPIIFLIMFMISAGFLWYEQKRMSG